MSEAALNPTWLFSRHALNSIRLSALCSACRCGCRLSVSHSQFFLSLANGTLTPHIMRYIGSTSKSALEPHPAALFAPVCRDLQVPNEYSSHFFPLFQFPVFLFLSFWLTNTKRRRWTNWQITSPHTIPFLKRRLQKAHPTPKLKGSRYMHSLQLSAARASQSDLLQFNQSDLFFPSLKHKHQHMISSVCPRPGAAAPKKRASSGTASIW